MPRFVSTEAAARATRHKNAKDIGASPRMRRWADAPRVVVHTTPAKLNHPPTSARKWHDDAKHLIASFTESDISVATTATQTTVDSLMSSRALVLTSNVERVRGTTYHGPRPRVDEAALANMGLQAKKRIEAIARRDALLGNWTRRRLRHAANKESQVMELKEANTAYKIVARMNISSSLREIMSVLSTDNGADFHRSMGALFGSKYLYGEKLHSFEKLHSQPVRRSSLLQSRTSRVRSSVSSRTSASVSEIKCSLHAVTLQLRHRLSRKIRDATFLEYLDEKVDAMTVTRVLQAIDVDQFGINRVPTAKPAYDLNNLLIGYVIREDPAAKFTRVFFYAEAAPTNGKVSKRAMRLARSMVDTLSSLVAVVERQRLTQLVRSHEDDDAVVIAAGRCCACNEAISRLPIFRHRQCACCRLAACHKCLELREISDHGDPRGVRVCLACVERVSLPTLRHIIHDDV